MQVNEALTILFSLSAFWRILLLSLSFLSSLTSHSLTCSSPLPNKSIYPQLAFPHLPPSLPPFLPFLLLFWKSSTISLYIHPLDLTIFCYTYFIYPTSPPFSLYCCSVVLHWVTPKFLSLVWSLMPKLQMPL